MVCSYSFFNVSEGQGRRAWPLWHSLDHSKHKITRVQAKAGDMSAAVKDKHIRALQRSTAQQGGGCFNLRRDSGD